MRVILAQTMFVRGRRTMPTASDDKVGPLAASTRPASKHRDMLPLSVETSDQPVSTCPA
jgi:hypothetical protein